MCRPDAEVSNEIKAAEMLKVDDDGGLVVGIVIDFVIEALVMGSLQMIKRCVVFPSPPTNHFYLFKKTDIPLLFTSSSFLLPNKSGRNMTSSWFLKLVSKCLHHFSWPVVALVCKVK
ncbi:hypothetical protein P8452_38574 [Trifolium repens]|nr:hypothetical protein P8452_38574 [Trifolium repens]